MRRGRRAGGQGGVVASGGDHHGPGGDCHGGQHAPEGAAPWRLHDRGGLQGDLVAEVIPLSSAICLPPGLRRRPVARRLCLGRLSGRRWFPLPEMATWLSTSTTPATAAAVRSRSTRPVSWGTAPRRMAVPPCTSTVGCGRCQVRGAWDSSKRTRSARSPVPHRGARRSGAGAWPGPRGRSSGRGAARPRRRGRTGRCGGSRAAGRCGSRPSRRAWCCRRRPWRAGRGVGASVNMAGQA